jgi:hypothetical protein
MVKLRSLTGVTYRRFPLLVPFHNLKSANNSKTMRVAEWSKEQEQLISVGLSAGRVISARWRHLLLIFARGAFRNFQKR